VNRRTRENKQGTGKYYGCYHCYRYYGNYEGHHFNVTDTLQIAAAVIIETFGIAGSSLHVLGVSWHAGFVIMNTKLLLIS
jgi:hypothetical protein